MTQSREQNKSLGPDDHKETQITEFPEKKKKKLKHFF